MKKTFKFLILTLSIINYNFIFAAAVQPEVETCQQCHSLHSRSTLLALGATKIILSNVITGITLHSVQNFGFAPALTIGALGVLNSSILLREALDDITIARSAESYNTERQRIHNRFHTRTHTLHDPDV